VSGIWKLQEKTIIQGKGREEEKGTEGDVHFKVSVKSPELTSGQLELVTAHRGGENEKYD